MEQSIFERLLASATSQSDYSEKEIAFKGKIGSYELHFSAKEPFNQLETHEFGYEHQGEWAADKPTPYQVQQMLQHISLEIPEYYAYFENLAREKRQEARGYVDPYEEYGVDRRDFI